MEYVLRVWGNPGLEQAGEAFAYPGQFLRTANIEAFGGRGVCAFTDDASKAMQFGSTADAMAFWNRQSVTRPTRPDGRPNKPLTAFTFEIVSMATVAAERARVLP